MSHAVKKWYLLTCITWPNRGVRVDPSRLRVFLEFYAHDKLLVLNWLRAQLQVDFFAMGSTLLLKLNYKFINGSQLWTQPSLQGFSVAVPFLSIYFFWRNLTEYRKHLPMVNAMVIKDVSRDLSQSEMETLYYNKLELFLLWMF